jgi:hypothetical protein
MALARARPELVDAGLCSCSAWSDRVTRNYGTARLFMVRRRSTIRFRKRAPGYEIFWNMKPSTSSRRAAFEWQRQMEQVLVTRCFADRRVERFLLWEQVPG